MSTASESLPRPDTAEPEADTTHTLLRAALPLVLLAVILFGPFWRVWYRWTDPDDYYTHGPLIPFICAYLVLRKRKELTGEDPPGTGPLYAGGLGAGVLYYVFNDFDWDKRWLFILLVAAGAVYVVYHLRRLKPKPWKPGLGLLIPALVFCVLAAVHEIVSVGWFFSCLLLVGLSLYYLGKKISLVIAFPLVFMFTSVPLPEYKVQEYTMPLKMFATGNAVRILQSEPLGIYCEQHGARIVFAGEGAEEPKEVTVGAVCSGLRSLIALISFGLLFAYITPLSYPSKALLFLATIPASFIANLFRILALALVTYHWDAATATGDRLWQHMQAGPLSPVVPSLRTLSDEPVHDFTGIMIFVVAFVALFALERLLLWAESRLRRARASAEAAAEPEGADG
jgi:exosortase